jgi:hypothetical protein
MADDERTTAWVEIRLIEGECLADPQPGAPKDTMIPRNRTPSRLSPAARITATISSTVGGSGGYRTSLFLGESPW